MRSLSFTSRIKFACYTVTVAVVATVMMSARGSKVVKSPAQHTPRQRPVLVDFFVEGEPRVVISDEKITHLFQITNTTDQTVRLINVDCGELCQHPRLAENVLLPGASTTLPTEMQIGPPGGDVNLHCTVHTDHKKYPQWKYHLRFPVYPAARFVPDEIRFGSVEFGQRKFARVNFETHRFANRPIFNLQAVRSKHISLTVDGPVQETNLDKGIVKRTTPVRVELNVGEEYGTRNEPFIITLPGNLAKAQIKVRWEVPNPIEMSPSSGAFFGKVNRTDGILSRTVILRSVTPFRILTSETSVPGLSVKFADGASTTQEVTVQLDGTKVTGLLNGDVVVKIDHPKQRDVKIPYAALGSK